MELLFIYIAKSIGNFFKDWFSPIAILVGGNWAIFLYTEGDKLRRECEMPALNIRLELETTNVGV